MKKILILAIVAIFTGSFVGCSFPTAKCHIISQNTDVIVDHGDLAYYEEGDTVILELREIGAMSWELASVKNFSKDTTYVFESQAGPYNLHLAKAVIKKKF